MTPNARQSITRVALLAFASGAAVAAIGVLFRRFTVAGYYALTRPSDISPHRLELWWLMATVVSVALTAILCVALELRRTGNVFVRAGIDVAVPLALFASAIAVGKYVSSTKSAQTFESLTPSALLLWAPALAATVAGFVCVLWERRSAAPPN